MDNQIPQTTKKKSNLGIAVVLVILFAIIGAGIFTFVSQPTIPKPTNIYAYMQNNFNSSISPYIGVTNITVYNSTIVLAPNPSSNFSGANVNLANITQDNKTYIFFFGLEASGQSAVETYVLWDYLTQKKFPSYDNFVTAQASTPVIPSSYILGNVSSSNPVLNEIMVPLTYQQAAGQSNTTNTNFVGGWLSRNITTPEAYLFGYFGRGNFPQVDVARTVGNKTIVCNAYSPFEFILYNATSSTKFLGEDMQGQTFSSLLPTTISMNSNLNTLNSCIETIERWQG